MFFWYKNPKKLYLICYDRTIFENLESEGAKKFLVLRKFLAMHINNQKLSFDIFTVGNLHDLNILMIFGIK